MLRHKFFLIFSMLYALSVIYSGCDIKSPTAPSWDLNLNLPFTNKSYNILDILKRSSNISVDSTNNDLVYLYGESDYKRTFGEDIKFDGLKTTDITSPSTLFLDTFIVVDDSTFVRRTEFLNGNLSFTFFNSTVDIYSVTAVLKNLFRVSDNDTVRFICNVNPGEEKSIQLNLADYFIKNDIPDNSLKLSLRFKSSKPIPVNFNYTLSSYSIKKIEGLLKPLSTGITNEVVSDPFGSDVPEGQLNFAFIAPNKNYFVAKKYSSIYQVDFTHISIIGVNKNGNRVKLKYLRNGNPGDPVEPVFNLKLPSDMDSIAFPINENNSNILEFINNIPKSIEIIRNDFLNLSYREGTVSNNDSISLKLSLQVPLDVSITEPIVFRDTVDAGITDVDQRKNLDDVKSLSFTLKSGNGIPLKATAKILLLDSFFTPLIAVTKIVGNLPDSSITVKAAPVGQDGFVNTENSTSFSAELDSTQIKLLKHMGKIIYEYKLYTDPDLIPPPLTTVKIRSRDYIKAITFGKVKYRININN